MGLFGDLKKIFFGAESLAKSGAEKTGDYAKEAGEELLEKSGEMLDKTKDVVSDVGAKAFDKAGDLLSTARDKATDFAENANLSDKLDQAKDMASSAFETAKDSASELLEKTGLDEKFNQAKESLGAMGSKIMESDAVNKAADVSESVGEKVIETGGELVDKAANLSENVGEKVLEKGGELMDKAGDLSENVGSKVLDVKDKMVDRAKEVTADLGEKLDETMEKAQKMAAESDAIVKDGTEGFADTPMDAKTSLLDGSDDFFSRADEYAKGNYSGEKNKLIQNKEEVAEIKKQKIQDSKAAGFEDLDGDGNELVDDAIIISEEE